MTNRRERVPFDPHYFEKLKRDGTRLSSEETFQLIHERNLWNGPDSVSGAGASRSQTDSLQVELPLLLKALNVRVLLDLPCGDFGWMQNVDLPIETYIGGDLVDALIADNRRRFGNEHHLFMNLDVTRDKLPKADLLFCRDCLVHLSFEDIFRALDNIRRSSIPYVLTTTFPECHRNEDITTGDWRLLNLEEPPFNLPAPRHLINEGCTEGEGMYRDKSLGLWTLDDFVHAKTSVRPRSESDGSNVMIRGDDSI